MVLAASIGALGSVAAGFLSSNASSSAAARQYWYQRALQEHAAQLNYDYSLKSAENMPTSTRAGLENAGYNPMLAVQNATGGANSNFTSAGTAGTYDEAGALNGALNNAVQYANSINQEKQVNSTVKANNANAFKTRMEGLGQQIKNKFLSQRESAEIGKTNAEATKLQSDTLYNDAAIENMKSRLELDRQLGFAGLDVQRYGINKNYASSIYNADSLAESMRGRIDTHNPFGLGSTSKYYEPDDVMRKPHRGNLNYYDSSDRKYWRNYY